MALTPVEDGYAELAAALYGDGAWEVVKAHALTAEQQKKKSQKTQARVALASNVVGLTAGTAGLAAAAKLPALRKVGAKVANAGPVTSRVATGHVRLPGGRGIKFKRPSPGARRKIIQAGAAGAVGLQAANLGGDAVANRVLSRSASDGDKKKKVTKSLIPLNEKQAKKKAKLVRVGVKTAQAAGDAAVKTAQEEFKKRDIDFVIKGEISKSNDKRQVFGWASVVELNGEPIVDLQGDYMAIDVIEKAAYDYVHSSRRGGDMHAVGSHASDLIESFIVTPEKKKQLNLPDEMPVGWWVGFQVNDDEVWKMVKDGKRPEFSIHGSGQRVDVEL